MRCLPPSSAAAPRPRRAFGALGAPRRRGPGALLALAFTLATLGGCEQQGGGGTGTAQAPAVDAKARLAAETVAQQFVAELSKLRYEHAVRMFDATMKGAMPSGNLASTWKKVLGESGDFVKMNGVRFETQDAYRIVFVKVEWTAASGEIKVVVDKDNKIAGLFFLPTTPRPGATKGGELPPLVPDFGLPGGLVGRTAMTGDKEWPLPGAFILPDPSGPAGKGPYPAVVLVHGSGPHDRDESIGPNKPFLELATELAKRGIVTFRYTKRTKQHGRAMAGHLDFTVDDETVTDALAAVKTARAQPEIAPKKVFVLGHSLGGYLLPRIGERDPEIAGLIGIAAPSRPLWASVVEQLDYITSLKEPGAPTKDQVKPMYDDAKAIGALTAKNFDKSKLLLSVPSAYWLDLKGYDPLKIAAGLQDMPWLFLQGGRDYQVSEVDFKGWQQALKGNKKAMFRFYPELNHLMQAGQGKATPKEYNNKASMRPSVFDDIASFIKRNSR